MVVLAEYSKLLVRRFLFLLILISAASTPILALKQVYRLDKLVTDVYATHPFFKSTEIKRELAKLAIFKENSFTDTSYTINPTYSYAKPVQLSPFTPDKTKNLGLNSSLSKKLWKTGGLLGASLGIASSESSFSSSQAQQLGLLSNNYEYSIGINYIHPLLKNKDGVLDKLNGHIKTYQYQQTLIQLADQEQQFVYGLINQFLDWYGHQQELTNLKDRYSISKTLFFDTKKKYKKNIAERVDLIQSEDSLKNLEQLIILQQGKVESKINQLELVSATTINDALPKLRLSYVPPLPTINSDLFKNVPQIALLHAQKELLVFQKAMIAETNQPTLDLTVGANLNSGDSTFGESFKFNKPGYSMAVTYSDSIEKTNHKIDDKILEESIQDLELSIDSSILTLQASLVDIKTQYSSIINVISANELRLVLAKNRVKEEIKRYNHGRGQFSFVVQAQDNVQFIESILLQNKISIYQLYFQFMRTLGLLDKAIENLQNEDII